MNISRLLKPKSPNEILEEFASNNKISVSTLKSFMKNFRRDRRLAVLTFAMFIWAFGLAMIINSVNALDQKYFWFPIKATHSMFAFINVFWAASWFAVAVLIIIYGIIIVVKAYND
jgi:hypothetical protein